MLGASETPYDLRFPLLGIPVRVHPLFWLVSAMLGWQQGNLPLVLLWVACVFASILVHEFGHALMARAYGNKPSVLLWGGGGLCYYPADRATPGQRLAILFNGPGAGFMFCGVVMIAYSALFGITLHEHLSFLKFLLSLGKDDEALGSCLHKLGYLGGGDTLKLRFEIYWFLLQINVFWGLVNLLPVWPLDGGQISSIVLSHLNPYEGKRWAHIVSLVLAGSLGVISFMMTKDYFLALFFGYFAMMNYQMLQSIYTAQTMGTYDDDWWRR